MRQQIEPEKVLDLLRNKRDKMWGDEDFSKIIEIHEFKSRFGLVWRGIRRERDTEMAISGGELAILDLQTGEIAALRRGFALGKGRLLWLGSWGCPLMARDAGTLTDFVRRVLQPKGL